ncbi:MAG TPA: hypothetical protein VF281_00145 [Candidatus Saccharimonadales bacterium]
MKRFLRIIRSARKYIFDVRALYALVGLVISLFAHELVHIVIHFGDIDAVHLLPDPATIVAITVGAASDYDMNSEELVAYAVSGLVQLITIIDVFAIHDSYDRKTIEKSVFKNLDNLSTSDSKLLLQIISK